MTLIVDVLKSMGYEVLQAWNGEEGLVVAASSYPDLILMDLSLPQLNGWTAAARLKADSSLQHIPIIALTAHAMKGDRERALEAGCDDYISKPINLPVLAAKLQEYIG
jgi:CheY-like chemotaxis protein